MAMVIMDKKEFTHKALCLLGDCSTYRTIPKDPTNKLKNKLIDILKDMKQTAGLKDSPFTGYTEPVQSPQSFMAFPKP